jgi:ribosomal protein L40E
MSLITCNECGEKISEFALSCPKCGIPRLRTQPQELAGEARQREPTKKSSAALGKILLLILFASFVAVMLIDFHPPPPRDSLVPSASVGDEVVLSVSSGKAIVADSPENFERVVHLSVVGDNLGIAELALQGHAFLVDSGTRVKIIDSGIVKSEVRIMEGQFFGRSGWVPREFLNRNSSADRQAQEEFAHERDARNKGWKWAEKRKLATAKDCEQLTDRAERVGCAAYVNTFGKAQRSS